MTPSIRGTKLRGYDAAGGAVVEIETDFGTYGPAHRAFTQSDFNAFFSVKYDDPKVPTSVSIYDAPVGNDTLVELRGNPLVMAKRANENLFTRVRNLRPDSLRILAGHSASKSVWDVRSDPRWIAAGAGSRSQFTALIARKEETPRSLERRLINAYKINQRFPDSDKRYIVPVIRIDGKHFLDCFQSLVEAEIPVIAFEVRGLSHIGAPLAFVHQIISKATIPPWIFALNVPRYEIDTKGSGALCLARYGVQSIAQQIFTGQVKNQTEPESTWWFYAQSGGYERLKDLGNKFESGCECPNIRKIPIDFSNTGRLLHARRRHETWSHMSDQPHYVRSVRKEIYSDYRDGRRRLDEALTKVDG